MAKAEIKIVQSVEASAVTTARPGDMLIITYDRQLADEEIDRLYEQCQVLLDAGLKVAFLDNVSGMVVFRPKEA
jgi:hypothetical protein